ncbi:MAG TPA: DUF3040 domain-containing protein [Actinoplanes sp.]|nr:DUF3040 domain-containing protein [Actinoplanes sp.]
MLSDRERAELAGIERALLASDRRFAATFATGRPRRERRWPLRALYGFGVLLLVVALLTTTEALLVQGLLWIAGTFVWQRLRIWIRAADRPTGTGPARRTRPDGWFRPV